MPRAGGADPGTCAGEAARLTTAGVATRRWWNAARHRAVQISRALAGKASGRPTPQRIAELDRAFRALIASRPAFSASGSDGFSCASFVTSILSSEAPELRVGLGIAVTGVASDLLDSGAHQALTLDGSAAGEAGSESSRFERLE